MPLTDADRTPHDAGPPPAAVGLCVGGSSGGEGVQVNTDTVRRTAKVCRKCAHPIGECFGDRWLQLGGAVIRQRLTFYCAVCKNRDDWRPREAG